ncbi:glycosyltransferase family 25 protein [Hymenobacter ruricola]|uniref:Glycosyltransferase family 25 protein n=1 Tax=Hymenobacter ruricola TaxID=2791023 RepID=A0ABS0I5F5_9BACT|nr:glycosyltransferase family 25 protein [Hymenobacter ruricola]MBF9222124.1 glycosyltransferase family 25 protein [Hymenobacter ruricola]
MKIFVINLARSTERRAFMEKQLGDQNLTAEFVAAVDGRTLTATDLATVCDEEALRPHPYWRTPGMVGCVLSHHAICQRMVADNIPVALVLEDDAKLSPQLAVALPMLVDKLVSGEIQLLFAQANNEVLLRPEAKLKGTSSQLCSPNDYGPLHSSLGYIISLEAAKLLSEKRLPMRVGADSWAALQADTGLAQLRLTYPFLVEPANFKSQIDYLPQTSLVGRISEWVERYRVFPLHNMLMWRRKLLSKQRQNFQLVK